VILSARDVTKSFSTISTDARGASLSARLEILRGVSLEVESPSTISIMGRSGCGKSTFISLLAGLDRATSGTIEVLGRNLNSLSGAELNRFRAKHIGIIFQQFHLLDHLTALENVRLPIDLNGGSHEGDERAREMLARVGLSHRADHFPDTMSRGEQQRVAIARVLVMKPEIVLADEPTGSLDIKTGAEVIELLFELVKSEKMALLMATHDPVLAARCDRHYTMTEGVLTPGLLK
jgi:putative ABC transport system ATP-binding protein